MSRDLIWRSSLLGAVLACAVLAACATRPPGLNPYPPVPPTRAEVIPKPPVSATPLTWQPGHYEWNGAGYVWYSGLYVQQAGHSTTWQPGYWAIERDTWAWQPAHWL